MINYVNIFIFILGGIVISLISNKLLLRFSQSLGIRNKNDVTVRWSNQSKPSLGGISLFVGFLFATFLYLMLEPDINIFSNIEFIGLFFSASLAFSMGLADDAYDTKPLFKLFIQISCGLFLVFSGTSIDLFHNEMADSVTTVVWVIILMNSLNMLDNMDGITATTVLFSLLSCLVSAMLIGDKSQMYWLYILVAVIGSILGFLKYNINPSKMFMGDAGSQFIGLFVAFFTIKFLWNLGSITQTHSWISLILTLTALTPAAADTLTVVINRLKSRKSPMVGGKDHTTHHLVYAGYKDRQVWIIFAIIGLFSFILSVGIIYLVLQNNFDFAPLFIFYFIIVFLLLYRNTIRYKAS
ncbi:MAG: MraY family glycosyltransferase [Crocinitomicaceae bacterium]|nr:MraY family glycosyltransferase [Crocinitomicaceae bacterium]